MLPVVLRPDEIAKWSSGPKVSMKRAHKFLTECRDRHRETQNTVYLHDLTNNDDFDWKKWVSQRRDALEVVGEGITTFNFVWCNSKDSNLNERRGDFMVTRIDNIDIRFHPQKKANSEGHQEAIPVKGSWANQWNPETTASVQHEALATSQGQGPLHSPVCSFGEEATFMGISSADTLGKKDAITFLKGEEAAWKAKSDPHRPFRVDITEGVSAESQRHFEWPYFVQRREWFRQHIQEKGMRITAFEVVRRRHGQGDGEAVFLGTRSDGRRFTVNPRARNQVLELSWNLDDITEF